MSDYQPVYDAIRSRFYGDFLGTFERAIRDGFDFGHARMMLQEQISASGYEMQRPSAIFRPKLFIDGNMWCALYGDDLMSGCAGFGETPEKAMQSFDRAWHNEKTPAAVEARRERDARIVAAAIEMAEACKRAVPSESAADAEVTRYENARHRLQTVCAAAIREG